jgi:hypothetical protein
VEIIFKFFWNFSLPFLVMKYSLQAMQLMGDFIWHKIVSHLDIKSIANFSQVNKLTHHVCFAAIDNRVHYCQISPGIFENFHL